MGFFIRKYKYGTVYRSFFGHRYVDNLLAVEDKLEDIILSLMREKEYVDFVVGRNGDFDQCVSSTVLRCKKKYRDDNGSLVLVLPYATAEYTNNQEYFEEYYDDIEVSYAASKANPKAAIKIRNREMVDRAGLIVCFVERKSGGAYESVRYAETIEKPIINIAIDED